MARRAKNSSGFEDLFGIAAAFPWWVGVVLAIVAYVVLHRYAVAEVPTKPVAGQLGQMMVAQMIKMFSIYLQYILPLIFLSGSVASYMERKKREHLVDGVVNKAADVLNGMTWQEFEMLVGEAFRLKGYTVVETGGGGADGGVDLALKKGSETFLVQCKQWKAFKVSAAIVRELYGVMAARGAAGGFVVTSGTFTRDAMAFAEGKNIELVEGTGLMKMINHARAAKNGASAPTRTPVPVSQPTRAVSGGAAPVCPRCGAAMIKRIAKQGANAGNPFWGCSSFPNCRGVIPI
jgi:restriction system protein